MSSKETTIRKDRMEKSFCILFTSSVGNYLWTVRACMNLIVSILQNHNAVLVIAPVIDIYCFQETTPHICH